MLPDAALIEQTAALLAAARQPMFFVGDGVAYSGAQDALTRLAELVGAEVWEADAGEVNMSHTHPLYQGMTGHMFGYQSLPITSKGDVNLICGTYVLPEVFPELGRIFAPQAKVVHLDLNAYEIAKNHPVDIGMVGDPQRTLTVLADALAARMTPQQHDAARARFEALALAQEITRARQLEQDRSMHDAVPLQMPRFMAELAAALPADALIFDEALTNSPPISRYFPATRAGQYFLTRGGSLGVGIPGAIGAKLANPDKTVVGFSGDGGSMYTIQALWTAARHKVDVKIVICNNASYRLLQANIEAYWQEREIAAHDFPLSFDLSYPPLHFAEMAHAMGVPAVRVEKPWEIGPAIAQALAHPGAFLIDLVLDGNVHPERIGNTCGQ
jgi:benzoylformate decarboxylase